MISRWLTHPPKQGKPVASDPQRPRVYYMERFMVGQSIGTTTDKGHMEDVLKHACRTYSVPCPKLVIGRSKDREFGHCTAEHIYLNASFNGANLFTMLHELAHWIVDHERPEVEEPHGEVFMAYYIDLLDRYRVIPAIGMAAICDAYGVRFEEL